MENGRNNEAEAAEIQVSGIHIEWNLKRGTCTFEKMPVAMMWVDTTLAGLMSGVQAMVGTMRFLLALQSEGRKSVETDWEVISQFPDFSRGFEAIANIAAVAGWGVWELTSLDEEKKECHFRVADSWEALYQQALCVCWGSGMLAGKMAGYCSKLFGTNCWADQTAFIAKGDAYDEFVVKPSPRSLETELENLLGSDEATRADMAVALQRLKKEIDERIRAEEELRRAKDELERRVQERTAELNAANERMRQEIAVRLQAEEAMKQSEAKLRDLARRLLVLQEEERQALSWDLQESLAQRVVAIKMDLRIFEKKLPGDEALREEYRQTLIKIDGIVENLRRRAAKLSPQMLADLGLTMGLKSLCESYGVECLFDLDDLSGCFSLEDQVSIYRVFQEAMNNVSRHAQASHVAVVVKKKGDRVDFLVEDNGRGFEVGRVEDLGSGRRGIGLAAMSERVRALGGTLKLESQLAVGTRIFFSIPRTRK